METIFGTINILSYLDISVIMFLLATGFIIKHLTSLKNKYIPWILLFLSFLIEVLNCGGIKPKNISTILINSMISAAIAICLHKSGKACIKAFIKNANVDEIEEELDSDEENDDSDDNNDGI